MLRKRIGVKQREMENLVAKKLIKFWAENMLPSHLLCRADDQITIHDNVGTIM